MTIAQTVQDYLARKHADYTVVDHDPTTSAMRTAEAAHVSGDTMAKSVLLSDSEGYVMAVIPAAHRLDIGKLSRLLGRRLGLVTEAEVCQVFADCQPGAVPPFGEAYGIPTVLDESLTHRGEVYFESGDHGEAVRMRGDAFRALLEKSRTGSISHHL